MGRESGRKATERGRGSCLDRASLSGAENLYSTPETDITAVGGKEAGAGRGVWRGEVFVEESAAGEQSSGTQVTGKAGSPSSGSRAGVGGELRGAPEGGSGAKGAPQPCRHQRSSIWHQGSSDPGEGSAKGRCPPGEANESSTRPAPGVAPAPTTDAAGNQTRPPAPKLPPDRPPSNPFPHLPAPLLPP